jgi:hypothetical protein
MEAAGAGRTEAAGACRRGDCGVRSSGSVELTLLALLVSPSVPLAIGLTRCQIERLQGAGNEALFYMELILNNVRHLVFWIYKAVIESA